MKDLHLDDLSVFGEIEAGTPICDDAYTVAHAMMQRARTNVESIIDHLDRHDYRFGNPRLDGELESRGP